MRSIDEVCHRFIIVNKPPNGVLSAYMCDANTLAESIGTEESEINTTVRIALRN